MTEGSERRESGEFVLEEDAKQDSVCDPWRSTRAGW